MATPLAVKPKETESAPLPAYPVAPPSQTQTSARGMTPPRHYAGGTAYAGVPKGISHYADGSDNVTVNRFAPQNERAPAPAPAPGPWARSTDPAYWQNSSPPLVGPIRFFDPQNAAPPVAPPTVNRFSLQNEGVTATLPPGGASNRFAPANEARASGMSGLLANPSGTLAAAVVGPPQHPQSRMGTPTPILNADPASLGAPTVDRGVPMTGLEPGGEGVTLKGQPYASTPQEVATAAKNTGLNPIALQNAAGAMSEPGALQNAVGAIANPQAHTPKTFADVTRGMSMHQFMQFVSMLRYDPAQQAWKQLHEQNNQRLKGMSDPNSPEAVALRQKDELEMAQKAGVGNIYVTKPMQQTDANGVPLDYDYTAGQPTQ